MDSSVYIEIWEHKMDRLAAIMRDLPHCSPSLCCEILAAQALDAYAFEKGCENCWSDRQIEHYIDCTPVTAQIVRHWL